MASINNKITVKSSQKVTQNKIIAYKLRSLMKMSTLYWWKSQKKKKNCNKTKWWI